MNIGVLIVARCGSSRVPRKAVLPILGKPVISHVIERAKRIHGVNSVALATTTLASDEELVECVKASGTPVFRGDPERVLDRVYEAAKHFKLDVVVSIGGDCPLVDPAIISQALTHFLRSDLDYLNNYDPPTFPEGFDINIIHFAALERAFHEAIVPSHRVHHFSYLTNHPELFKVGNYTQKENLSHLHWSLDFPEDFEFISEVYKNLYAEGKVFLQEDILKLCEENTQVGNLNKLLIKPPMEHAFWNSPGIIRDMHTDIQEVISQAQSALSNKDYAFARRAYDEVKLITNELHRMASYYERKSHET